MPKKRDAVEVDPEVAAISSVYAALKDLESSAQTRVLNYVRDKLKLTAALKDDGSSYTESREQPAMEQKINSAESSEQSGDELEGVSPVAKKWMARNGLEAKKLSALFSLGVDEIDLVAKKVPGKNKKERMHSVFLLKGVAAYIGTGAARFTHEQMKEACLHYDAFDAANFAVNFKSLTGEVSGSKESGYTLTARGLAAATEMIKALSSGAG
ncbi:MAG TPA: hypothetical protein VMI74_15340 [Burkholderiales bacterium]|nr:hypothetical protein [Burkholderiales bacterium]